VHRSRIAKPMRALAQKGLLPRSIWVRLPVEGSFDVTTVTGSFHYHAPVDDYGARLLFWRGAESIEPESLGIFEHEASRASVVVDVGANRGVYTLAALAASPNVKVIAVEPSPTTFDYLSQLVELNGWTERTTLLNLAAADEVGNLPFHVPKTLFATSARLVIASHRSELTGTIINVPVVVLDDVVTEADVVKIDVEGAEHLVLAGMTRLLERSRPVIFIEVLPEAENARCQEILSRFGYRFFHLRPEGEIERPGLEPDPSRHDRNYVCRPPIDSA
jgi:FkbM family methyltransferase